MCKCEIINNWDDLLKYYYKDKISTGNWMFRAEKTSDTPLQTSLDKEFAACEVYEENQKREIEKALIRAFRRRYHLHADGKMTAQDNLETVALMQHYGAPTRALDWTYSFFVAVYFAVNRYSDEQDSVVWCLDKKWLNEKNETETGNFEERFLGEENKGYIIKAFHIKDGKYKDKKEELERLREGDQSRFQNYIVNYINKNPEPFIYAASPYYLNDRLAIQQGALLFACDITKSWKENLYTMMGEESDCVLREIRISKSKKTRKEFLEKLYEMNINQSTLFPGLGGFAESLTTRIAHPGSLGISKQQDKSASF